MSGLFRFFKNPLISDGNLIQDKIDRLVRNGTTTPREILKILLKEHSDKTSFEQEKLFCTFFLLANIDNNSLPFSLSYLLTMIEQEAEKETAELSNSFLALIRTFEQYLCVSGNESILEAKAHLSVLLKQRDDLSLRPSYIDPTKPGEKSDYQFGLACLYLIFKIESPKDFEFLEPYIVTFFKEVSFTEGKYKYELIHLSNDILISLSDIASRYQKVVDLICTTFDAIPGEHWVTARNRQYCPIKILPYMSTDETIFHGRQTLLIKSLFYFALVLCEKSFHELLIDNAIDRGELINSDDQVNIIKSALDQVIGGTEIDISKLDLIKQQIQSLVTNPRIDRSKAADTVLNMALNSRCFIKTLEQLYAILQECAAQQQEWLKYQDPTIHRPVTLQKLPTLESLREGDMSGLKVLCDWLLLPVGRSMHSEDDVNLMTFQFLRDLTEHLTVNQNSELITILKQKYPVDNRPPVIQIAIAHIEAKNNPKKIPNYVANPNPDSFLADLPADIRKSMLPNYMKR